MRVRWLTGIVSLFLAVAGIFAGYFYWFYEEPRALGPLAQDLIERFEPWVRNQNFDEVIATHIEPDLSINDRQGILKENGFDCAIRPAEVVGSEILSCRRPIEGRHYCDRFNYYAYQTAAGEVIDSLASIYSVGDRDKILGRCPYSPFPESGPMLRFPHDE